jgi:hypothetical protein
MKPKNMAMTVAWLAILLVAIGGAYVYVGYTDGNIDFEDKGPVLESLRKIEEFEEEVTSK